MVRKYIFGEPIETDAVVKELASSAWSDGVFQKKEDGFHYSLKEDEIVYGLGENVRGINKRGWRYISNCSDNPNHCENTNSLYGAHNFIMVGDGVHETYGLFVDTPGRVTFDIGYTDIDDLCISMEEENYKIYLIEADSYSNVVKEFRELIGRSYIAPRWAFGYGQSRWSYDTADEVREVVAEYKKHNIPMDSVYLDIDYMERYKDFTINRDSFADFEELVEEMRKENIHLVPIIDGGVKKEDGYDVYEEGKENGYFCKDENGEDFIIGVWPGKCCFPDMLDDKARQWFGDKYRILIDKGIDGFWNDMNEPAIFFTPEGVKDVKEAMKAFIDKEETVQDVWAIGAQVTGLANNAEDYAAMYHNVDGKMVQHDQVHNLFGYNMTRAAGEGLREISPDKRCLLFSRSSYIGMHRYGGIWTGDNKSWWSHILLNLKMLPSLNMCGFLYTGADLGGFGCNTTRDLLLRWLALGVFTPLMRDHTCENTREQECYQFEHIEDFRHIIGVRYRLIPYIYSEYMKAALTDDMMFKPLAFEYPEDRMAVNVEDQLMLGNEIMIAPVYTQNAIGRYVYLPEAMMLVRFCPDGKIEQTEMPKGHHFVEVPLNEVILFIRQGKCIPLVDAAECVDEIDMDSLQLIGYANSTYQLYDDDGYTRAYDLEKSTVWLKKEENK